MTDFPIRVVVNPGPARTGIREVERSLQGIDNRANRLRETIDRTFSPSNIRQFNVAPITQQVEALRSSVRNTNGEIRALGQNANRSFNNVRREAATLQQTLAQTFAPVRLTVERQALASSRVRIQGVQAQVAALRATTEQLNRSRLTGLTRQFDRLRVGSRNAGRSLRTASREAVSFSRNAATATRSVNGLQIALTALVGSQIARGFINLAAGFERVQRRIRAVSADAGEAARNLDAISRVSDETGTSLSANAQAFQRLSVATGRLGLTGNETAGILRTLNQAFVIGGSSTQEINAAITQLGQGLASDRLQGDELRSLLESAPILAERLAEQLGVTVGELRELGAAGQLNARRLVGALQGAASSVDADFRSLGNSFDQTVARLNNAFLALGQELQPVLQNIAESLEGVTSVVSEAAQLLGQFRREDQGAGAGPGAGRAEEARAGASSQSFFDNLNSRAIQLGTFGLEGGRSDIDRAVRANQQTPQEEFAFQSQRLANDLTIGAGVENLDQGQLAQFRVNLQEAGVDADALREVIDRLNATNATAAARQQLLTEILGEAATNSAAVTLSTEEIARATRDQVAAAGGAAAAEQAKALALSESEVASRRATVALQSQVAALNTERETLAQSGPERDALQARLRAEDQLRRRNIDTSSEAVQAQLEAIETQARENSLLQLRAQFLQEVQTPEQQRAEILAQLDALLRQNLVSQSEYNRLIAELPSLQTDANAALAEARESLEILRSQNEQNLELLLLEGPERDARAARLRLEAELLREGVNLQSQQAQELLRAAEIEATRAAQIDITRGILEQINPTEEQRAALVERIQLALADGVVSQDELNQLMADFRPPPPSQFDNFIDQLERARQRANDLGGAFGRILTGGINRASTALAEFVISGGQDIDALREQLANILRDIAIQITAAIIQAVILNAILGPGGAQAGNIASGAARGVTQGALDAGQRRAGGGVSGGRRYLVNEGGPELFVPSSSPLSGAVSASRASRRVSSAASRFATRIGGGAVIPGGGAPSFFTPPTAGQIVPAAQTAQILGSQQGSRQPTVVQAPAPTVEVEVAPRIMVGGREFRQAIRTDDEVRGEIATVVREESGAIGRNS